MKTTEVNQSTTYLALHLTAAEKMDLWGSVRKAGLPQNKIERPKKGGGYRRKEKFQQPFYHD